MLPPHGPSGYSPMVFASSRSSRAYMKAFLACKLTKWDLPLDLAKEYGFCMMGIHRQKLLRLLVETAEKHGVQIKWGHKMIALEQHDEDVHVTFANGYTDTASFVVGCDGLHSNTRMSLFGRQEANFTGLTQVLFVFQFTVHI